MTERDSSLVSLMIFMVLEYEFEYDYDCGVSFDLLFAKLCALLARRAEHYLYWLDVVDRKMSRGQDHSKIRSQLITVSDFLSIGQNLSSLFIG